MNIIELSELQKSIVYVKEGSLLIKASAGSGKTRVLTERIKILVQNTKRKILAITFTNKAAEEMKVRLENVSDLNERAFIGTFHGFCQQVLESHGKQIGLLKMPHIFEDEADRLKLIEEALFSSPYYSSLYKEKAKKEQTSFLYNALGFISETKRKLISEDQLMSESEDSDFVLLYKTYQDILLSQNAIDFDDLILLTYNLFATHPSITSLYRRTYEYICIDEAQDLNNAQYQLLKILLGEQKNIMMVGDPNQSIFAFNGSSPDYMTKEFVKDFNPRIIELKENYRSAKKILEAADRIIPGSSDIKNAIKQGIFEIKETENETSEAQWIFDKIKNLIETKFYPDIEGALTFEKIVVLGRNKYVFTQLESIFNMNSIPYYFKITPGSIKYVSDAMKIFDLALKVKINPQDSLHFIQLKSLIKQDDCSNLEQILQATSNILFKKLIELVFKLSDDGGSFKTEINDFGRFISDSSLVNDDNEKNMILKDIDELQTHWYNYATKVDRKSLSGFKNSMALGQTHPLSQNKGITLSTVHTMKGQEYDVVFLMGLDDETFPDYRAIKSGGINMVQEKNNLYVAFTRAKRFLFVTWPRERMMPWGDVKQRKRSRLLQQF